MAFGLSRQDLKKWKHMVSLGEIAFLTHYWLEPRFPDIKTVTKVGCSDLSKLTAWCEENGLNPKYIHLRDDYPHFDLIGSKQIEILYKEKQWEQLQRFGLLKEGTS